MIYKLLIALLTLTIVFSINLKAQNNASADGDFEMKFGQMHPKELNTLLNKKAPINDLDAGDSIEGDLILDVLFFDNGKKILSSNFQTQNLSVMDWTTKAVMANIPLSGSPSKIAKYGSNMAIALLPFENKTAIIDLTGDSVLTEINTPGQPNSLQVDQINDLAYVATFDSQLCYVIDLNNLLVIDSIVDFYSGLQTFSFITSNNRSGFAYYDFKLSPDGQYIAANALSRNGVAIHDVMSQQIDTIFPQISPLHAMAMSDSAKVLMLTSGNTPKIYQYDLNSKVLDSVELTGQSIFSLCRQIVPSSSGEEVIICLGTGLAKVNFQSNSFTSISSNATFWMAPSFDNTFAFGGGFYSQIVNIANGNVVANYTGKTQSLGAAADSGYHMTGIDPLRQEYFHAFEFNGSNSLNYAGDILPGSTSEADVPFRVAISDDGSTVLVANQISKSASIIDADSLRLNYLVDGITTGSFGCAMTSDGKYGLVADYDGFAVHIIHIPTGQLIASPAVGDRPSIIRIAPGDTLALITNTRSNNVTFLRLDSANSAPLSTLSVGVIGISFTNKGIFSDLQISPNGTFALVAASFDDQVKVISVANRNILSTLNVGDFPTQIAYNDNGNIAAVLNKNENTFSLISVSGAFSSVIGSFPSGTNPTRIVYDSAMDAFAICNNDQNSVRYYDANSGQYISQNTFGTGFTPIQSGKLPNGEEVFLLNSSNASVPSKLRIGNIDYNLSASPSFMAISKNVNKVVACVLGPDRIIIYEGDPISTSVNRAIETTNDMSVFPNPVNARKYVNIDNIEGGFTYRILDLKGQVKASGTLEPNETKVQIPDLLTGIYTLEINSEKIQCFKKLIIN